MSLGKKKVMNQRMVQVGMKGWQKTGGIWDGGGETNYNVFMYNVKY